MKNRSVNREWDVLYLAHRDDSSMLTIIIELEAEFDRHHRDFERIRAQLDIYDKCDPREDDSNVVAKLCLREIRRIVG